MPQISIILTTYNRAALIGETLASIRAQTLADWECIVVDDGGTDDTRDVVAGLNDSRFRYIWQENAKLPAARMSGMAHARGELIAFLDDDDVWLPEYLETVSRPLRERPQCVYVAAARLFWDGEHILETQKFTPQQQQNPLRAVIRFCIVVPSQSMIRRAAFDRTPGFRLLRSEDYDLWLQLMPLGESVLLNAPLVKYRVHAGGVWVDPTGGKRRALAALHIVVLRNFLRRRDITLYDRLLAAGNIQRKHEQLLEFDLEDGQVPPSRWTRLARLLSIVPSPLLRNPPLARQYLAYKAH